MNGKATSVTTMQNTNALCAATARYATVALVSEPKFKARTLTNEIQCPWCENKWNMWDDIRTFDVETSFDDKNCSCQNCGKDFYLSVEPEVSWQFVCRYQKAEDWE
jgi:hypothetical protein